MLPDKITSLIFFLVAMLGIYSSGCKKESVFQQKTKPEIVIDANSNMLNSQTIHFYKDTVYVLATNLSRDSSQTLVIDAGTLIKVNDKFSITINPGATIEAKGTVSEPIVFTSAAFTGGAGLISSSFGQRYWSGIRIYGNALHSITTTSGTLSYVRIEFAGDENFIMPSLLLSNVSKETIVNNVQVSYSTITPSFEFAGGNFNAANLISYAGNNNADFLIRGGYTGMLQNLLAYRHPYFPNTSLGFNLTGLLIRDTATVPVITNLTVLGPNLQKGTNILVYSDVSNRVAGMITTGGAKFHIRNSVLLGFPKGGWYLDDNKTAVSIVNGESDFTYSIVHSNDSTRAFYLKPGAYPPYVSQDFKDYMLQQQFGNHLFVGADEFMLADPFNYDVNPNPLPKAGSPILSGANFDGVFSDPFFKKVDYRGALGSDNWLQGWTNFVPLQTNYNN